MVYKLDVRGARADSLLIDQSGDDIRFMPDEKTLWYEISNHRFHDIPQGTNSPGKKYKWFDEDPSKSGQRIFQH